MTQVICPNPNCQKIIRCLECNMGYCPHCNTEVNRNVVAACSLSLKPKSRAEISTTADEEMSPFQQKRLPPMLE